MTHQLSELLAKARAFEAEAHSILAKHESSRSRVVVLGSTYRDLTALPAAQQDLLKQALRCVEHELYRAAHVMAWAAFMDFLEEKMASDGLNKVRAARPAWKANTVEDFREYQAEHQIVELSQALGLCGKNQMKALLGLLNKRNECAHPSAYYPQLNETLGYISEVIQRIRQIAPKSL